MKSMKYLSLAMAVLTLLSCGRKNATIYPVRQDITQAVYASGKVFPVNNYRIYSKLPGYIEKIHVRVGDSVKTGQALITLSSEVSEKNVEMARNQWELAQKNAGENSPVLAAVREDLSSARSRYVLDSTNYVRFQNLAKENAASALQLDQYRTQHEISKQNYLKAQSALISTRDRLRTEMENARLQWEAQSSNKNDYVIISSVNGKVYDIVPKEGELVGSQLMLMELGKADAFEVELSVDETDVALLAKGQEIVYTIDAYKDQVFKGRVLETYPRINASNKTSKVMASIELQSDVNIFSGMSVEANIIIRVRPQALVVPREYFLNGNRLIMAGSGDTVKVEIGAQDLQYFEVTGGLDEKAELIRP